MLPHVEKILSAVASGSELFYDYEVPHKKYKTNFIFLLSPWLDNHAFIHHKKTAFQMDFLRYLILWCSLHVKKTACTKEIEHGEWEEKIKSEMKFYLSKEAAND